ncbi:MAG TPA: hypothetical protein VGM54_19660 [Chthoniobacter sp.]|jgi:hypothetical protein
MNAATELPQFARDLLSAPPKRGEGLNFWLFRVARVLHAFRTEAEIVALLRAATAGEPIAPGEIERQVKCAKAVAWQPGASAVIHKVHAWPPLNPEQREAAIVAGGGVGVVDLWEASPMRLDRRGSYAEEVIPKLFPDNPLLCCGKSNFKFATRPLSEWSGGLAELQFMVPSPMTARTGITKEGRPSEHALSNTGPRRFLVVEQDQGTLDDQASVLLHLAKAAPLALAVYSGGKSIHGWFMAAGQGEDRLRRFMCSAVTLGADPATWTRSQFVRMPGGTRHDGNHQTIYFFNPAVIV